MGVKFDIADGDLDSDSFQSRLPIVRWRLGKTHWSYEDLVRENQFLRSVFDTHYSSLVGNLRRKTSQGVPIWIDIQTCSLGELRTLDSDPEVTELINSCTNIRYRDR